MDNLKEIVAANLTSLRKSKNLTQSDLAEKLNYSDKAISKWENGESLPGLEVLYELTKMYGVTLDYLISVNVNPLPSQEDLIKEKAKKRRLFSNRLAIFLLCEILVYFFALSVYVYGFIWSGFYYWPIFIWAIPVSAIVAIVFNGIWGKRILLFPIVSVLLWSFISAIYVQFLTYDLWALFLLGIPPQAAIILWSNLKKIK